jgi:hypothetical protein
MARKPEELVGADELAHMLRNDKKTQQTSLVAQIAAVMPNGRQYTASDVSYATILIPEKTLVTNIRVVVTEAFDAGATFDVGTADNPTAFCSGISGDEVTTALANDIAHNTYYKHATEVFIKPTYADDNTKGEVSFVFEIFELEASIGRHTR